MRNLVSRLSILITMTSRVTATSHINVSFFVTPTNSSTELMKITTKLSKSKSPGYDNVGPSLITDVSIVILDPIVHIFNLSLLDGCVSDKLNIVKVIPLFKKDDRSQPSNYIVLYLY